MSIIEGLTKLLEPIGARARAFAVDYRDDRGRDYNRENFTIGNYDDYFIIGGLIKDYESQGFEISAIHEVLDGYSLDELETLAQQDMTEAMKHLKLLYLNEKAI